MIQGNKNVRIGIQKRVLVSRESLRSLVLVQQRLKCKMLNVKMLGEGKTYGETTMCCKTIPLVSS